MLKGKEQHSHLIDFNEKEREELGFFIQHMTDESLSTLLALAIDELSERGNANAQMIKDMALGVGGGN